jgi:hypothetical protein
MARGKSALSKTHPKSRKKPHVERAAPIGRQAEGPPPDPLVVRGSIAVTAALVLAVGLIPVQADDLWWTLARGRTVLNGSFTPSRELLIDDQAAEADWLGGVPFYLVHQVLKEDGLMFVKLLAAIGIACYFFQELRRLIPATGLALGFLVILPARLVIEPGPALWDGLGIIAATMIWSRYALEGRSVLLACGGAVTAAWANLSPLSLIALGPAISAMAVHRGSWSKRLFGLGVAAGSMCLTPRGLLGPSDSLRVMIPPLACPPQYLGNTPFESTLGRAWDTTTVLLVVLGLAGVVVLVLWDAPGRWIRAAEFAASQALAWISWHNVGPAALWGTLVLVRHATATAFPDRSDMRPLTPAGRRWFIGTVATGLAACPVIAGGGVPGWSERLGWGLAPVLDPTALASALESVSLNGSAVCVGRRAAGLIAWLEPPGVRPLDVPNRSLLGGRQPRQFMLEDELTTRRDRSYMRDDGTWGGWWVELVDRKAVLVVAPAERADLTAGLSGNSDPILRGFWRPLSLEAETIPFGLTGHPDCQTAIETVMRQESGLSWSDWQPPDLPGALTPTHVDLWRLLTTIRDARGVVRRARSWRSLQLNMAAARLLAPALRDSWSPAARREFGSIQAALAFDERVEMGKASRFRAEAWQAAAGGGSEGHTEILASLGHGDAEAAPDDDSLARAVGSYVEGEVLAAAESIDVTDDESMYAAGWLWLEAGRPVRAAEQFQGLCTKYPQSRLCIVASHLSEVLHER